MADGPGQMIVVAYHTAVRENMVPHAFTSETLVYTGKRPWYNMLQHSCCRPAPYLNI